MADPQVLAAVVWLGVLLGVASRTWIPYINAKLTAGGALTFDRRYLISAIGTLVAALPTAQVLLASFAPTVTDNLYSAFVGAFLYGLGINHFLNEWLAGKGL